MRAATRARRRRRGSAGRRSGRGAATSAGFGGGSPIALLVLSFLVLPGCSIRGGVAPLGFAELNQTCLTTRSPTGGAPVGSVVRWYSPDGDRDASRLARWCETVGPAVYAPAPERPSTALAHGGELTVVSWNVAVGAGDLPGFLASRGLSCDAGPDPTAPPPIVLVVQEALRVGPEVPSRERVRGLEGEIPARIDPGRPPSEIREVAARCGLALLYVPSMRNGPGGPELAEDRGNAILSTLPLYDPIAIELPFESQRRVAVGATILAPGGETLRVVSVHLDTFAPISRALVWGDLTRVRQVRGVIEALDHLEGREVATSTLTAGDLNTWSHRQGAIRALERHAVDSPVADGRPTVPATDIPADHMFFRRAPRSTAELVPGSYRPLEARHDSDHLGRELLLRWTPREPADPGRISPP